MQVLRNLHLFNQFVKKGYDYILNPSTGQLHKAIGGSPWGSHDLVFADLRQILGLYNLQRFPIHLNFDGVRVPIFDEITGRYLCTFPINKCGHCFPKLR
jgi:hypothetical protein